MQRCDTLLDGRHQRAVHGVPAATGTGSGGPGRHRRALALGSRYPTEVNLHGDAADTLSAAARAPATRAPRPVAQPGRGPGVALVRPPRAPGPTPGGPLNPQLAVPRALTAACPTTPCWPSTSARSPTGTPATSGSAAPMAGTSRARWPPWVRRCPYAVAAKLAAPERLVVALLGDGAMQMNGINELITVARMWRDWADPRLPSSCSTTGTSTWSRGSSARRRATPRFAASQTLPLAAVRRVRPAARPRRRPRRRPETRLAAPGRPALGADRPYRSCTRSSTRPSRSYRPGSNRSNAPSCWTAFRRSVVRRRTGPPLRARRARRAHAHLRVRVLTSQGLGERQPGDLRHRRSGPTTQT